MHGERFSSCSPPGLTVRDRLAELKPSSPHNVYDDMGLVPRDLRPVLNRARVEVMNFQAFNRQNLNTLGFPRSGSKGGRAHRDLIGRPTGDEHLESYEQSAQACAQVAADGERVRQPRGAQPTRRITANLPKSHAKRSAEDKKGRQARRGCGSTCCAACEDMGPVRSGEPVRAGLGGVRLLGHADVDRHVGACHARAVPVGRVRLRPDGRDRVGLDEGAARAGG